MSTKHLLAAIKVLLFVLVIGTPLFYFKDGVYPYTLSKQEFFQSIVEVMGFLWLALIYYVPKYRPRRTPLVVIGAVFLGLLLIVSFTGVDWWRSLWSTYERAIGVIAFFHLALLGLITSSLYEEIPWRKLFFASLCVSIITVIIAFIQLHVPDLLLSESPGDRPGATFGNPIFLSGYLLFHVFLGAYFILDLLRESDRKLSGVERGLIVFALLATLANTFGIFLAQTRGDILALAVGLFVLLAMFSFRPPQIRVAFLRSRWIYVSCLLAILFAAGIFALTFRAPVWSHIPGASRFQALFVSFSLTNSTIAARVYALHAGSRGLLDRPWLGWGPENFTTVSSKYYDPRQLESGYPETRFDKPHNFILEYLISGGIPLLVILVGLFGAAIYETFRGKNKLWSAVFVAAISAYVAGEFFEFETIGPLMMLYVFFGYTDGAFRKAMEISDAVGKGNSKKFSPHIPQGVSVAVIAIAVLFACMVNVPALAASYYQYEGFHDFLEQNLSSGLNNFHNALALSNPYRWNFARDYTAAVLGQYFNYPGTISNDEALHALHIAERVRDEHPEDAYDHYALINFYNEVAAIDPKTYTADAEREAEEALKLSPNRQEVYFLLAKTKTIEGDYIGSLRVLRTALDLDPKVPDAHFYYGILAFATGDQATGYNEIESAITMGRRWKTFNEPRVVANDFADAGHLNEAIDLYRVALEMNPGDIESNLKLGVAYYYQGDKVSAREYLMKVVASTDLTKLPSYRTMKPILDALGILPPLHTQ